MLGWSAALALAIASACQMSRHMFEEPDYTVTQEAEGFELRQYGTELVAETIVEATNSREATRAGFRRLADYIFGNNIAVSGEGSQKVTMTTPVETAPAEAQSQKIAMTTPVEARPDDGNRWVVTFILPAELTLETAPRPKDQRVTLRERPGQLMAVKRFSGSMDHALYEGMKTRLLEAVARAGYVPAGSVTGAQYDPPGVLPSFRRNEVMVPVSR